MKSKLGLEHSDLVDLNSLKLSPEIAAAFVYENAFNALLRPDNHIGDQKPVSLRRLVAG
jgi:hypothetical protein